MCILNTVFKTNGAFYIQNPIISHYRDLIHVSAPYFSVSAFFINCNSIEWGTDIIPPDKIPPTPDKVPPEKINPDRIPPQKVARWTKF